MPSGIDDASWGATAIVHVPQTSSWPTSGEFGGGYVACWNCEPGITVDAAVQVGAGEMTPAYGEYANVKTGTEFAFSASESVTEGGVGQDCARVGATIPWKMRDTDGKTPSHYLDLSLPIIRDSDGAQMTLWGSSGNVPFRRSGGPSLAKLVLPEDFNYQKAMDGNTIFGDQP